MDRIESFLDGLPGYTGYRDKESRRDSDKRLRDSVANQLESIAQRVERGGASLAAERRLDELGNVESLVRSLNHLANLVKTQSYGYGGIFTDTPVDERALNQLYLFDKGLALKVSQLDSQLAGIEAAITGGGGANEAIQQAKTSVQGIADHLEARKTVVETAAPAATRSLFAPVDVATAAPPPPPIEIEVGDAIAWFDEDFLVDAVIDVRDRDNRARFFHIGTNPDRWLAIAEYDERVIALLEENPPGENQEAAPGDVVWSFSGSGSTRQAGGDSIKADAFVTFYSRSDDQELVAYRLLSGTDERYLTGKRVHPDDLSIYGKPAKS